MSVITEISDLKVNLWGEKYDTASARVTELEEKVDLLLHSVYPTFDTSPHSPTRIYDTFTFVKDLKKDTYVSLRPVPKGIPIKDTRYWKRWYLYEGSVEWSPEGQEIESLKEEIERLKAKIKTLEEGNGAVLVKEN